jgi:hypothetical protein
MTETVNLKNYDSLKIYKRNLTKYWWVSFYVKAKSYNKNGLHRQSLKVTNQREAERKAKEIYKNFDFTKIIEKKLSNDFRLDIFEPFIKHKERRKKFKDVQYTSQRDKQQFQDWIEPYFQEINYRNITEVEEATDEMVSAITTSGLKEVTCVKYISLLSQMFGHAKSNGVIEKLPTFPVLNRIIGNQRLSYQPKEVKLIVERIKQEYQKTEDIFYDEMVDYIRWCIIDGFRQGLEPMNIRHFQVKLEKFQNYEQGILRIHIKKTKTGKENFLEAYPEFVDINWSRIQNRYPNPTSENFIFFPQSENRLTIWNRVRKNFVRFSRELGLYMKDGRPRPMTALRHMSAQRLILKGHSLDDVSMTMNTSTEMLKKVYLHSSNKEYSLQRHINKYKDYYTRRNSKKA